MPQLWLKRSSNFPARLLGVLLVGILPIVHAQPESKESTPQLRIICVSSLVENQDVVLASRDDKGAWQEHANVKLRSSFISDWLPAHTGELHLALRGEGELQSICKFVYPDDAKRVMLVLLPDPVKKTYMGDVINPAKLKFAKGSTLLVNYSPMNASIMLGSVKTSVKPGERVIVKPVPDKNGMFRMLVAYTNENKQLVPCYDRYISNNEESRDLLLLLPDPTLGLRVYSLPEF